MRILFLFSFILTSILSFSDNRKIISYQIEKKKDGNHIEIKISEEMFKYKIVWGDTLSELANQFDTTVKKLAKDNNIKNIDLIYAGEDLDVEKKCNNYKEEKKEKK